MADQFSHYSFSSTSQTSSSRRRPRRLRVKKYTESLQNGGSGLASSIDMTGVIRDDGDGDDVSEMQSHSSQEGLSRQSSVSTENSAAFHQKQPGSLLRHYQSKKTKLIGRISHSLATEEVIIPLTQAAQTQPEKTDVERSSSLNPSEAAKSKQSSSDGDEVLCHHLTPQQTTDGSFPSNTTTIPELDSSKDSSDPLSSITSALPDLKSMNNISTSSNSTQQPAEASTTIDSDKAWAHVVQHQTDVRSSLEEEVSSSSSHPPSSSVYYPFVPDSIPPEKSTSSRYEVYRASLGRNFYQDETILATITKASTSSVEDEPTAAQALTAGYARKEMPLEDSDSISDESNSEHHETNDVDVLVVSPSAGLSVFEDDSDGDDMDAPSDRRNEDGGFPSTAAMLALALAHPPTASRSVSKRKASVNGDRDDHRSDEASDDCSGEEYEIEIPDEDYDNPEGWGYESSGVVGQTNENERELETATAVAYTAKHGQENISETPINCFSSERRDEAFTAMEDVYTGSSHHPRSKSVDHIHDKALWTRQETDVRSSESPSNTSATSEPPPVTTNRIRERSHDKDDGASWRKSLGALFRMRYSETEPTEGPEKLESAPCRKDSGYNVRRESGNEPLQMSVDGEDQNKKQGRMLATSALSKSDDIVHISEASKAEPELDPNDRQAIHASLALAAVAVAAKWNERVESGGCTDQPEGNTSETDVTHYTLASQVAAVARRKISSRTAEDYDKLYKKEVPKAQEPKLMVQLRSVHSDPATEDMKVEGMEAISPGHVAKPRPVSRSPEGRRTGPLIDTGAAEMGTGDSNDNHAAFSENGDVRCGRNGSEANDVEACQAVSNSQSIASSITNVDPLHYEERKTSSVVLRHTLRLIAVLIVLTIIALLLYFLVFAKSEGSSPDDGTGDIFPSVSETPSPPPFSQPSNSFEDPILSPIPSTLDPQLRPSAPTTPQETRNPSFAPSVQTSAPSQPPLFSPVPPASPSLIPTGWAPTQNPTLSVGVVDDLEELLMLVWPPLEDILNNPDASSSPQVQALDWMKGDPNLDMYSDDQKIQRFTMSTFFYSTGGDQWLEKEGWLTYESECTWFTSSFRDPCNNSASLVYLELNQNRLSGTLPVELALLSNSLTRMSLAASPQNTGTKAQFTISGSLPSEYGLLTKLEYIDLSYQRLTGMVASHIGQLSFLTVLDMKGNELNGTIPTTIGQLGVLNNLYMAFNNMSGAIPSELGQLSLMVNLDFEGNQLSSTLPTELGNLSILRSMSLGYNKITGTIPTHFGKLSNILGSVSLSGNLLTGTIPTEMGQLEHMRAFLNLSFNQLTGVLPVELGRLVNLRILDLQNNLLTGPVPVIFSDLMQLEALRLESNMLTGMVPPFVCKSLVTDRVFSATLFVTDCVSEVECSCCQYCCEDGVGCECQFANTDNEFLCTVQGVQGIESRSGNVP